MSRFRLIAVALLAFAVAGFAVAQNANLNTGGPTKNDYRLNVIQPMEGAKIVGSTIQVVVDTEIPAERDVKHDTTTMPHPDVDVFLDGTRHGTMRDANNVLTLENVALGPHTILFVALNRSREVIDRKEIHVINVAPEPKPAPVVQHAVPPRPAPAPPPPPPAEPPAPAPALPKTATADPLLAMAGLALVLGGLALRRLS